MAVKIRLARHGAKKYFLAILPSTISVTDANMNIISEIINISLMYVTIKNGVAMILATVNLFGKFILNLSAFQIVIKCFQNFNASHISRSCRPGVS